MATDPHLDRTLEMLGEAVEPPESADVEAAREIAERRRALDEYVRLGQPTADLAEELETLQRYRRQA